MTDGAPPPIPPAASTAASPGRALVTGGTGFLGRPLVARLLRAGWHVRCLIRMADDRARLCVGLSADEAARLECHVGSLMKPADCEAALADCRVVYHVAAALGGAPARFVLTNVVGTRVLVEAVRRRPVERFVLVSSVAVLATAQIPRHGVFDEQAPLEPRPQDRDPYCYSKVIQERVCWEAHRGGRLPLVVVRPGVLYGPGREGLGTRVGLRFGNVMLRMGGRQRLPYVYVDNAAQGVLLAGTAPGVVGESFNLLDDELPTGRQMIRAYRRARGRLWVLAFPHWTIGPLSGFCEWYHRWSRGQLPAVLTRPISDALWKPVRYDNGRAKTRLGWRPEVGLAEGLARTFAN